MKHNLTGSLRFGQETLTAQQVIGMAKVDPKAPLLMCISTIEVDPHSGTVAIGRIFSGSIDERQNSSTCKQQPERHNSTGLHEYGN